MHRMFALCVGALALVGPARVSAQETPIAFEHARIYTIDPEIGNIDHGTLVMQHGKIVAVGPADEVAIPDGAQRINATGRILVPGRVDPHSHIGGVGGAAGSGPTQAERRAFGSST